MRGKSPEPSKTNLKLRKNHENCKILQEIEQKIIKKNEMYQKYSFLNIFSFSLHFPYFWYIPICWWFLLNFLQKCTILKIFSQFGSNIFHVSVFLWMREMLYRLWDRITCPTHRAQAEIDPRPVPPSTGCYWRRHIWLPWFPLGIFLANICRKHIAKVMFFTIVWLKVCFPMRLLMLVTLSTSFPTRALMPMALAIGSPIKWKELWLIDAPDDASAVG